MIWLPKKFVKFLSSNFVIIPGYIMIWFSGSTIDGTQPIGDTMMSPFMETKLDDDNLIAKILWFSRIIIPT